MGRWVLRVASPLVLWWRRGLEGCEGGALGRRGGCRESEVVARGEFFGPSRRDMWGVTREILSNNSHPSVTDGCECLLRFEFASCLGKVPHRSRQWRWHALRKGPGAGPGGARGSFGSPVRAGGRARGRRARVPAASVGSFGSLVAESVEHRSNAGPGKILEGPKPLPCQSPLCASRPDRFFTSPF